MENNSHNFEGKTLAQLDFLVDIAKDLKECQRRNETRFTALEVGQARIHTWGAAAIVFLSILQFYIGKFVKI